MSIKPIIFGSTGMVGEGVLHVCLHHPEVESVLVINRRPCEVQHPKLTEIIHSDFYNYSSILDKLKGYNACYFCLGVTSIGKSEAEYTRITYNLTMAAAKALVSLNPDMTFCYVSGAGTDGTEKGKSMWARVKGKTENDVAKLPFRAAYAFRPGFIKPIKGLKHGYRVSRVIGTVYPLLKLLAGKYVCTLEDLGLSMIHVSTKGYDKRVLECVDIARTAEVMTQAESSPD